MGRPLVLLLADFPTRDPAWMTTSRKGGEKHATGDHVSGPGPVECVHLTISNWPQVDFETNMWVETWLWWWSQGRLKVTRTVSITTLWCTLSRPAIVRTSAVAALEMVRCSGCWVWISPWILQLGGQKHLHPTLKLILFLGHLQQLDYHLVN